MRLPALPTLALVAALFGAGALLADRSAQDPDPGVRYVDLQRCLDTYQAAQKELTAINQRATDFQQAFSAREAALQGRRDEMRVMDPASEAYAAEAHAIEADLQRLRSDMDFARQQLQNAESQLLVRTWTMVQKAASRVGAREGFGAVMVIPKDLDPELLQQPAAALEALQYRNLLWSNPSYDVTELVVEVLNQG
jgi:Skp family chaperone for outer membrane proteins